MTSKSMPTIVSEHADPANANKSPNDEVERRGVAPTSVEADLYQSSTHSPLREATAPRSFEPSVRRFSSLGYKCRLCDYYAILRDRAFKIRIKHMTPKGQLWHLRLMFKINASKEHNIRWVNPMTSFKLNEIRDRHTNAHFSTERSNGVISP
jgi:hypothetical protein